MEPINGECGLKVLILIAMLYMRIQFELGGVQEVSGCLEFEGLKVSLSLSSIMPMMVPGSHAPGSPRGQQQWRPESPA